MQDSNRTLLTFMVRCYFLGTQLRIPPAKRRIAMEKNQSAEQLMVYREKEYKCPIDITLAVARLMECTFSAVFLPGL